MFFKLARCGYTLRVISQASCRKFEENLDTHVPLMGATTYG
jgi:hypothetical protein